MQHREGTSEHTATTSGALRAITTILKHVNWGYGAVHAVDVNNRVRNLAPGRRGGPEVESLSRAAEPLRPRGPPAAARGLPAPAAHERRGGQQALELRLCQRHAGNRIQRPVGGSPLPGRAGLLPRRRGAVVGQARAPELQLVGRGIPGVQQLFRIRGRVPGGDRQGVLPAATARKTQTSFHHGFLQGEEEAASTF